MPSPTHAVPVAGTPDRRPVGSGALAAAPARVLAVAVAGLLAAAGCRARPTPADLVLRGGKVATVDSSRPEAEAIAISGDTIVAVGSDAEIGRFVGPDTRVLELHGALAIPGFIEGHGHLMALGESLTELDLRSADSWEEIVRRVKAAADSAAPGRWIVGRGWHQEKWTHPPDSAVGGLPNGRALDAAVPDRPVLLEHASGHAVFVNRRALRAAGIGDSTPDPEGGEIVRDARGRAIGMLRDNAMAPVWDALNRARSGQDSASLEPVWRRQLGLAVRDALSHGITSFQDEGEPTKVLEFLKRTAGRGELPIRVYAMVEQAPDSVLAAELPALRTIGYGGRHLTIRAVGELYADGALGTHTAWMLRPYDDQPSTRGLARTPLQELRGMAEVAVRDGFQLSIHAIGDRANREALDLYASLRSEHPELGDPRWRIEHAQHLSPTDIPRFAKLGVVASMQAIHACSDGPWVIKRIGERRAREGAYAWHRLLESGAVVTNGTDVPVEPLDPIPNFVCAVTRRLPDGSLFFPEEAMSRRQALRAYTLSAAYAAFQEDVVGSLAPGKLADVTVLSRDILTVPAEELPETRVLYTIVGGRVEYRAEPAEAP